VRNLVHRATTQLVGVTHFPRTWPRAVASSRWLSTKDEDMVVEGEPISSEYVTFEGGPLVAVFGINVVDCKLQVPRLPSRGETILSTSTSEDFGGKGANQAVQASLLLGPGNVSFISRVGADARGEATLDALVKAGVDCSFVSTDETLPTGFSSVIVDPKGQNTIVVAPGANSTISVNNVLAATEQLATAEVVLCQLEADMQISLEAFRLAELGGSLKILNVAPVPPDPYDPVLLELCHDADVLCMNELEAAQLLGWDVGLVETNSGKDAVQALLEKFSGCNSIILTLGEKGVCLVTIDNPKNATYIPGIPCTALDTVGAGDSFVGALAVALCHGVSMQEACEAANEIAALSVQFPGTQGSYYEAYAKVAAESGLPPKEAPIQPKEAAPKKTPSKGSQKSGTKSGHKKGHNRR